jgi:hypothetical protein
MVDSPFLQPVRNLASCDTALQVFPTSCARLHRRWGRLRTIVIPGWLVAQVLSGSVEMLSRLNVPKVWTRLHEAQLEGLQIIFKGKPFGHLTCDELRNEAIKESKTLTRTRKTAAYEQLDIAIKGRELLCVQSPFPRESVNRSHNHFIGVLIDINSCLLPDAACELRSTATDNQANMEAETADTGLESLVSELEIHRQSEKLECSEPESPTDEQPTLDQAEESEAEAPKSPIDEQPTSDQTESHETVDDNAIRTFLEYLSASVDSICKVFEPVAEGKLEAFSGTAGMLFTRMIILTLFTLTSVVAMWLFQELRAMLAVVALTSPKWFTILQDGPETMRETEFQRELNAAKAIIPSPGNEKKEEKKEKKKEKKKKEKKKKKKKKKNNAVQITNSNRCGPFVRSMSSD